MGKPVVRTRRNSLTDNQEMDHIDHYLLSTSLKESKGTNREEIEIPVVKGDFNALPASARKFIAENVRLCKPKGIYICDGSDEEAEEITEKMVQRGLLTKLENEKYENWCFQEYTEEDYR